MVHSNLESTCKKAGEWMNSTMEKSPSSGFEYVQSDAMILLFPTTFTYATKNKGSNTNGNRRIRFLRKDLLCNEVNILRTFSQSTHEIPVPIMAKRHICTELVPFIGQLMLQLIPESVQHLKLKLLL